MTRCYNAFGEVPREGERRPRRGRRSVELPVAGVNDMLDLQMSQAVRPEALVHFFRYRGTMYQFREAVRSLCSLNRRRTAETRRAQETLTQARAAGKLGQMLGTFARLDRISPPRSDRAPQGFVDRCQGLLGEVNDAALLINPLPRSNPGLYRRVGEAATLVRNLMRSAELRTEVDDMVQALSRVRGGLVWASLALTRVVEITELALAEVEQTQVQEQLARDLQGIVESDQDHILKTLKTYTSNTAKGFKLVSHAMGVLARARVLSLIDNPTAAGVLGRQSVTYWCSWLDGLDAEDINARLRSGQEGAVRGVDSTIRRRVREAGASGSSTVSKIAKALGYVQALFVVARFAAGENSQTGLSAIQDTLSTGAAFNTLGQGMFTLLGGAQPLTTSGVGLARLFTATANVLKTVGTGLSVASAVVSICSGLATISDGWHGGTNVNLYDVGSGALQVSAGVCVIVGVLCTNPVSAAAGVVLGLLAAGVAAAEPDDAYAKQVMVSLLDSIEGRGATAERMGINRTRVQQLLNYARGVDSQDRGMDEFWDYWVVRTSHTQQPHAGPICDAWRVVLTEAGFSESDARMLITV